MSLSTTGRYPLPAPTQKRQILDDVLARGASRRAGSKVSSGPAATARVPSHRTAPAPCRPTSAAAASRPRMDEVLTQLGDAQARADNFKMSAGDARKFVRDRVPSSEAFERRLRREMGGDPAAPIAKLFEGKSLTVALALLDKVQAALHPKNARAQLLALSPAGEVVQSLLEQTTPATLPKLLAKVPNDGAKSLQDQFSAALKNRSLPELAGLEAQLDRSEKATANAMAGVKDASLDSDTQARWGALRKAITAAKDQKQVQQKEQRYIEALSTKQIRERLLGSHAPQAQSVPKPAPAMSEPASRPTLVIHQDLTGAFDELEDELPAHQPLIKQFKSMLGPSSPDDVGRANKYFGKWNSDDAPGLSKLLAPVSTFAKHLTKARGCLHGTGNDHLTARVLPDIRAAANALLKAATALDQEPSNSEKEKSFKQAAASLRDALKNAESAVGKTVKKMSSGSWLLAPRPGEKMALSILQKGLESVGGNVTPPHRLLPPLPGARKDSVVDASGLYRLMDDIAKDDKTPPVDMARALRAAIGQGD